MDGERMMTRCAGRFTPAASVEVATSTLLFFFGFEYCTYIHTYDGRNSNSNGGTTTRGAWRVSRGIGIAAITSRITERYKNYDAKTLKRSNAHWPRSQVPRHWADLVGEAEKRANAPHPVHGSST